LSFIVRNTQGDITALVRANNKMVELYNATHYCTRFCSLHSSSI